MSGDWQTVHFPFEVLSLQCELSEFNTAVHAEALLFCLKADQRLSGIFWTDAYESNFVYLPELAGTKGESVKFAVDSTTPWTSAQISLQPWGKQAPSMIEVGGMIVVRAHGVIGEERREYTVSYQWRGGAIARGATA